MNGRCWFGNGIAVILGVIAALGCSKYDPYSFLDEFHPKRVEFAGTRRHTKGDGYVLVFSSKDAKSVLESMESHLLPGKEYRETHLPDSGVWLFPKDQTSEWEGGAGYATHEHEHELPYVKNLPVAEPGGCVVMIYTEPTRIKD